VKSGKYIVRRVLETIPVVFLIISFNFILIHISPGDPAVVLGGQEATPQFVEAMRVKYGLDKPLYQQYIIYFTKLLRGDLGYSWSHNQPVSTLIMQKLPTTLLLMLSSLLFSFVFGTILGVISARNHLSKIDDLITGLSLLLYSMPAFWLGIILILLFGINLNLFPVWGLRSPTGKLEGLAYIYDILWHLFLPMMTVSFAWLLPIFTRITRSSVIEIMNEDFIIASRGKGLDEKKIFYKHALRNAILPTVTQAGLILGLVFGGAITTETVFALPGLGRFMYESVFKRDYPVLMGLFLVASITVIMATLVTDIICSLLDPRIVYE
jgi:peptide/nickel transport system permease protein